MWLMALGNIMHTQLCSARKMKQVLELINERSGGEELLDAIREIPKSYYEGERCDE